MQKSIPCSTSKDEGQRALSGCFQVNYGPRWTWRCGCTVRIRGKFKQLCPSSVCLRLLFCEPSCSEVRQTPQRYPHLCFKNSSAALESSLQNSVPLSVIPDDFTSKALAVMRLMERKRKSMSRRVSEIDLAVAQGLRKVDKSGGKDLTALTWRIKAVGYIWDVHGWCVIKDDKQLSESRGKQRS